MEARAFSSRLHRLHNDERLCLNTCFLQTLLHERFPLGVGLVGEPSISIRGP